MDRSPRFAGPCCSNPPGSHKKSANRADVAGGSILGNLLGRQILMPMVDIGVGQLAMHSAMETASCKDAEYLANACAAYYNTPIFQPEDGQWKLGL